MGKPGGRARRRISQAAFDDAVRENAEEFDLPPDEAVQAAVEEFALQGVDLTGIVKRAGVNLEEHPAVVATRALEGALAGGGEGAAFWEEVANCCKALQVRCSLAPSDTFVARSGALFSHQLGP